MSLADAFKGMKGPDPARTSSVPAAKRPSVPAAKRLDGQTSGLPLQGTAKSKHPEFEKVTIYVRSATRRAAFRRWEDSDGGDFSDLVERLLAEYAGV